MTLTPRDRAGGAGTARPARRGALSVIGLVGAALLATAAPASADQFWSDSISGAYGSARYDDGLRTSWLRGYSWDNARDGWCAETWLDFTTRPHKHFDAYAIRACGNQSGGWGKTHTKRSVYINGVRAALCRYQPSTARRECTASWPHDSVRSGTFHLDRVG